MKKLTILLLSCIAATAYGDTLTFSGVVTSLDVLSLGTDLSTLTPAPPKSGTLFKAPFGIRIMAP